MDLSECFDRSDLRPGRKLEDRLEYLDLSDFSDLSDPDITSIFKFLIFSIASF